MTCYNVLLILHADLVVKCNFQTHETFGEIAMSLVKVKNKFQVTIPAEIRDKVNLAVGDVLEATIQNNNIVLKPKAIVDRESLEAAIAEGLEDYEKGRVFGPFKSVKEFKAALKKS